MRANNLISPAVAKVAKADKRNRGELARIHIEPAENGYTVSSHFEPKKQGPNAVYPDPEQMVFGDAKSAVAHVSKRLAEHEQYEKSEQ